MVYPIVVVVIIALVILTAIMVLHHPPVRKEIFTDFEVELPGSDTLAHEHLQLGRRDRMPGQEIPGWLVIFLSGRSSSGCRRQTASERPLQGEPSSITLHALDTDLRHTSSAKPPLHASQERSAH